MQTLSLTGASCGVTMRWGSICARERVSLSESWIRRRPEESTHLVYPPPRPPNLLTPRLLSYYLLRPFCFSAFIPLPRPKWQLLKNQTERWCLQAKGRKLEGGKKSQLSWETDRLTVKKKNKTLKAKTRAPLLVGLPFLLATVVTNWRSGEGHFLWGQRRGLPCGVRVKVCVRALGKEKHFYNRVFFPSSYIRGTYLCIPVHVKQHIQTADVCVSLVGPCVHLGGGRLCLVGTSCTAFQEWEFLRGLCLSSNSLLYKYRL